MKRILAILLFSAAAWAQRPALIHVSSGENSRAALYNTALDYYLSYAEPVIAGNCIGVFVFWNNSNSPTITVSDDQNGSYGSPVKLVTGLTYAAGVWVVANSAASAHKIDLHFTTETDNIIPITFEEANCATSKPVDASSGQESSGNSVSAGSLTPTSSGEQILQFAAIENANVPASSSMSAGSQSAVKWVLQIAELLDGIGMQSGVYNSTDAINPTFLQGTSTNGYISIAIALKTAASGGLPSGMYVIREQHVSMWGTDTGGPGYNNPSIEQFPCSGNLLVVMANGGSPITNISENSTNLSYAPIGTTYPATYIGTGASESEQVFYEGHHQCNNSNQFAITPDKSYTGNGSSYDYTLVFYDIADASALPSYDTASTGSGDVTSCSPPCNLTGPSVIPDRSGVMIFNMESEWYGQVTGITGPGVSDTYYVQASPSGDLENPPVDQQNGWAHYYTTSKNAYDVTWTFNFSGAVHGGGAQGYWAAVAGSFEHSQLSVLPIRIPARQSSEMNRK